MTFARPAAQGIRSFEQRPTRTQAMDGSKSDYSHLLEKLQNQ
jgi:hypothetical protein